MDEEARQSRRGFLRQLGITLAAGVGAVAFPAMARGGGRRPAGLFQCCPSSVQCSCPPGGGVPYWCDCGGSTYCVCRPRNDGCVPAAC